MKYNTEEKKLVMPEYGRNIQNMVDYCITIEDREERKRCADTIINHVLDIASVFGHNQFLFFCIIFHYHIHLSGKCTYFN